MTYGLDTDSFLCYAWCYNTRCEIDTFLIERNHNEPSISRIMPNSVIRWAHFDSFIPIIIFTPSFGTKYRRLRNYHTPFLKTSIHSYKTILKHFKNWGIPILGGLTLMVTVIFRTWIRVSMMTLPAPVYAHAAQIWLQSSPTVSLPSVLPVFPFRSDCLLLFSPCL